MKENIALALLQMRYVAGLQYELFFVLLSAFDGEDKQYKGRSNALIVYERAKNDSFFYSYYFSFVLLIFAFHFSMVIDIALVR